MFGESVYAVVTARLAFQGTLRLEDFKVLFRLAPGGKRVTQWTKLELMQYLLQRGFAMG